MPEHSGLLASVRQLLATLAGVVSTRLELLANEWQEERLRLAQILFLALVAAFSLCMAAVLMTLFIVILFWDEHRLAALGWLAFAFFFSGAVLAVILQSRLQRGSKLFSESLAELARDRRSLGELGE